MEIKFQDYDIEVKNWAEKAVVKCNAIAEDYGLDYSVFQKPYEMDSDTLILALNPYDKNSFPTKKVEAKVKVSMTAEKFLTGNTSWNGYKTNWKVIKQLMKLKLIDDLDLNFNYMNYVYFPSKKFTDIRKLKEIDILSECKNLTLDFLKIIKPKKVILLGTSSGIDQFEIEGSTMLVKDNKRLIVKGKIDGIDIYTIPHPSWLNDDELAAIDINLAEIFSNQKQSHLDFVKTTPSLTREIIDAELKIFNIDTTNPNFSDILMDGLEDEKILIRINYKSKIIGIRNADKNNYENLKYHDFYSIFFLNVISEKEQSWAFQKKIPSHFFGVIRDITKGIFYLHESINYERNLEDKDHSHPYVKAVPSFSLK